MKELIDEYKLCGTIITSDLKWDCNNENLVKRANMRMSKLSGFRPKLNYMKIIYTYHTSDQFLSIHVKFGTLG